MNKSALGMAAGWLVCGLTCLAGDPLTNGLGSSGAPEELINFVNVLQGTPTERPEALTTKEIPHGSKKASHVRNAKGRSPVNDGKQSLMHRIKSDPTVMQYVIVALSDRNPAVRIGLYDVVAACSFTNKQAAVTIVKGLRDPDAEVRKAVAQKVGTLAKKAGWAANALVPSLKDNDSEVRRLAGFYLGMALKNENLDVAPLAALVRESDPEIRQSAATLLGKMGRDNPEALEPLVGLAMRDSKWLSENYEYFLSTTDIRVGQLLRTVMEKYGDERMAVAFLNSNSSQAREAAGQWVKKNHYEIKQINGTPGGVKGVHGKGGI
ncbi:MAG: HEAT repeat domain-containing protein [bacterium]